MNFVDEAARRGRFAGRGKVVGVREEVIQWERDAPGCEGVRDAEGEEERVSEEWERGKEVRVTLGEVVGEARRAGRGRGQRTMQLGDVPEEER